jgi:hypothetical protein
VQILHPFTFTHSAQQYAEEICTPDRCRPDHCPQCQAQLPLIAHGFYSRTLVEAGFDSSIRVRRSLCRRCRPASCRPMADTVCRIKFPLLASRSARVRARADAQGRCDGAAKLLPRL